MKTNYTYSLLILSCLIFSLSCKKEKKMDWKTNVENFSDPIAKYTASDLFIQPGDSIYFVNCSKIYDNISWDFGDGAVSNDLSPRHIFKTKGIFNVTITATHRKVKRQFTQQVYCGMKASAEVTFNFSNWNIPADYIGKNYTIVIDCSLYKSSDTTKKIGSFNQLYSQLNSTDSFKITFLLSNENSDYQVKTVLRGIYPIEIGPSSDVYETEQLGNMFTNTINAYGITKTNGSKEIKYASLNYSSVVTIN